LLSTCPFSLLMDAVSGPDVTGDTFPCKMRLFSGSYLGIY